MFNFRNYDDASDCVALASFTVDYGQMIDDIESVNSVGKIDLDGSNSIKMSKRARSKTRVRVRRASEVAITGERAMIANHRFAANW